MDVRELHPPNGQTRQDRHVETPVLHPTIVVTDTEHMFTSSLDKPFPLMTRIPDMLHLEGPGMPTNYFRVPHNVVSTDLPGHPEHRDHAHGIVYNKDGKCVMEYFEDMTGKVVTFGTIAHAAAGLIKTIIVAIQGGGSL